MKARAPLAVSLLSPMIRAARTIQTKTVTGTIGVAMVARIQLDIKD
jgi:hypothetical protein